MESLQGRVAIVTGAARGIGLGIATVLRDARADVVVADVDEAMLGLMRSAALEVAGTGVTINAVLPGSIASPGFADLGPEHRRRMLAAIPLGKVGEPEDVGWAVRFLAASEAQFITGQTLIIDGGQVLPESGD
jgi:NAD(P)-dependent dehydrogenase (short-subunit alcohol dehydrogenase family)